MMRAECYKGSGSKSEYATVMQMLMDLETARTHEFFKMRVKLLKEAGYDIPEEDLAKLEARFLNRV